MWGWLARLLRRGDYRWDTYRPGERVIYRYWDGAKEVAADPMTLYQKMMAVAGVLDVAIRVANTETPIKPEDRAKARTEMLGFIRGIFGVRAYEAGGLTEQETTDLLDHFMIFCELCKKKVSPTVTSPAATSPTTAPSSDASPNTPPTSGTGSTGTGPPTAGPPPSSKPSESPSDSLTPA